MDKNRILGLGLVAVGAATLFLQLNLLRDEGRFYVAGAISSVLVVFGVAALLSVNLADGQLARADGTKEKVSFKDMPGPLKVTFVLAIAAAVGQLAFFKFGSIL